MCCNLTASTKLKRLKLAVPAVGRVMNNDYLSKIHFYYRTMLCIRGTSHGPVSVCLSVRHKSAFY